MHPAKLAPETLLGSCQIRRQRRSGPGGQHRNKVETGIFIEHTPTGLRAESTEFRSQSRNQENAVFRLRVMLAIEHRERSNAREIKPTALWASRLKGGKIQVNERHVDFPSMLAEAMDALQACEWDPKLAKERLCCSSSQLIKLLKKEPRAFAWLNRKRLELGLSQLR